MKKILLFAVACVALAACNNDPENADLFKKDQKVTLTVCAGNPTKLSGTPNNTTDAVDFKWETGDKIKVTVGAKSSEFTLKSGAGESVATFEGTMPEAGTSFNAQYPVSEPDLTSQAYVADGLPKEKMKMTATDCTITEEFTLTPQYSVLRLNLWGVHIVSKIAVDIAEESDTLDCGSGVAVGTTEDNSTAFLIVVPEGSFNFEAKVYNDAETPVIISNVETTDAQTFTAGQILGFPAIKVETRTPTIGRIDITGTMYVGDAISFSALVDGFSEGPAIDYFVKLDGGEYELLDESEFTPETSGSYYVKAYAAYESEETEKEVPFTVIDKPVDAK